MSKDHKHISVKNIQQGEIGMRRDQSTRFAIYTGSLTLVLSLGLIFGFAQAQAAPKPVPPANAKAQADIAKRRAEIQKKIAKMRADRQAAIQKDVAQKTEAVKKDKETAKEAKAADAKKLPQKPPAPNRVVIQQRVVVQGNIAIKDKDADKTPGGAMSSILPEPDRETINRLMDAKFLIDKERFGEAVQILGDILSLPNDSFFTPEGGSKEGGKKIRGLHDEAEQILGALPLRAMELYELQFGSQAKQLLEKSLREGNSHGPADVSRRFFYTKAGMEATWLSGLAAMDECRWKAAVLSFDRFQKVPQVAKRYEPLLSILKALCMEQAGQPKMAEKTWKSLRERSPEANIQIAGKSVPLFADSEETFKKFLERTKLSGLGMAGNLLNAFANQTLPFGTPDRNASVDGSLPLLKRAWRVRITDRPETEAVLKKQWESYIDNGKLAISHFRPLVVDGVLFCRTIDAIMAVDVETGKRIWVTDIASSSKNKTANMTKINGRASNQIEMLLNQIWGNSIFGQLTCDTRNLYAIDVDPTMDRRYFIRNTKSTDQGNSNTLVAIDLQTGEQRWSRSSGNNNEPFFFLGPPLPLDGFLYALAEVQGEIQLVVLSAGSGEIEWSQRIAIAEQIAYPYTSGYSHAQMPAMLEGVMVCPTGTGAIVAIEPTTRSLLWAHCYERLGRNRYRVVFRAGRPYAQNQDRIGEELILHGNYVISAPIDSEFLYCLDLRTGEEIWKKQFVGGAFLGGVHNDKILVVGSKKFQTLDIGNGEVVGECFVEESLKESGNVVVTGCGFRNEGVYYVAVSSDEILALDIDQCKVVHKIRSREPMALGNLIAVDDRIFSQSLNGIEAFHQLKAIRLKIEKQLKKDPDNLEAMAMQAELLLAEGHVDKAIKQFHHIYDTAPTQVNRSRLLEAYCVGLKDTYAVYRNKRPEIEALLNTDQQKADYWYCVILGETEENNLKEAAHACFELAGLSNESRLTISTDRYHEVQRERFVQAQLGMIYGKSDAAFRQKLADMIVERIDSSIQSKEFASIKGAWNCFASLPPVVEHQGRIVDQLWKVDPMFAELALEQLIRFSDKSEAATAMVHWAELLRQSGRLDEAAACYREAIHRWSKVPLLTDSGQTVLAKLEGMPLNDPVRSRLDIKDIWPKSHKLQNPKGTTTGLSYSSMRNGTVLQPVGLISPIFRGKNIFFTGKEIVLIDEYGREVWKLSLGPNQNHNYNVYYGNQVQARCSTVGHMIFLETSEQVVAINVWDMEHPKIAWQSDNDVLVDVSDPYNRNNGRFQQKNFSGLTQSRYNQNLNKSLGLPGLFIGSQVLSLNGRGLFALDPYDGTLLWSRRKIPNQIDLQTDGNLLLIFSQAYQRYDGRRVNRVEAQQISLRLVDGSYYTSSAEATSKTVDPSKGKDAKKKKEEEVAKQAGQLAARLFMNSNRRTSQSTQKVFSLGRNMLVFANTSRGYSFTLVDNLTQKPIWGPRSFHNQTRWTVLGQDYLGTIDHSGNFSLLRISDGKTMIQRKLKVDGSLLGLYLQDLGDRVGVVISTQPRRSTPNRRRNYYHTSNYAISEYVQQGRMYILHWDGRSALEKHPEGFTFEDQGVLLDPPQRLPVVTFLLQSVDYQKKSNQVTTELKVFDARSGDSILSQSSSEHLRSFEMTGDPERKSIEYLLNRKKFLIQFE